MTGEGGSPPSRLRLYGLIWLMTALWAANFVISKIALREMPALLIAGLRTALAGLLILPLYSLRRHHAGENGWTRRDVPRLVTLGIFGVTLNQVFFVAGVGRTSVAHAALIIGLTPILVLLIAAAIGQERLTAGKLAGMGIALAGVVVLQASGPSSRIASWSGDLFVFIAALTFAIFTVSGKGVSSRFGSITVNTFAYVGGGLTLMPLTIWQGADFSFHEVSSGAWMALAYMAAFPSVLCYLIYYYALTFIPASRLSAFSYVQPLLATGLAYSVLGEHVTWSVVAGGALVLAGVYLTERA